MRKDVELFLRDKIRVGLDQCTEPQRDLFRRMYGGLYEAVPLDKLEWALSQVERTLAKKAKAEGEAHG